MEHPRRPLNKAEAHIWDERLAILMDGREGDPTPQEIELAWLDVDRFKREKNRDSKEALLI